jgi:uncharacterized membrane-anchored protein
MSPKKFIIIGSVVAIIQLLVPAWMIYQKELVIQKGITYLFPIAPVDPHDPFIGKYISLNFLNNSFISDRHLNVQYGNNIYAVINKDNNEKVVIEKLRIHPPKNQEEYIKVRVSYSDSNRIMIEYPFNVFYMEEFKANKAEEIYRKNVTKVGNAFAVVKVYKGQYVIIDVIINGKSIVELSQ